MKLQFKHQQFQADAAWAVFELFTGQPNQLPDFRRMEPGCQEWMNHLRM